MRRMLATEAHRRLASNCNGVIPARGKIPDSFEKRAEGYRVREWPRNARLVYGLVNDCKSTVPWFLGQ